MRVVEKQQLELGEQHIGQIQISRKSRDDIPALLIGIQHLYMERSTRQALFDLLEAEILPNRDHRVGRPGMALWTILVLAVIKQGLGCDFDRLQELANHHNIIRKMLGHGGWLACDYEYQLQTLIDNVSLLSPALLSKVNELVVSSGHEVARKKPGAPLRGRADSFVVETDVHYPTDVNLLWDAQRCLIRDSARIAKQHGLTGWRQQHKWRREVKRCFDRVSSARRWNNKSRVRSYLKCCQKVLKKSEETLDKLKRVASNTLLQQARIEQWQGHVRRQMEQVEQRLLKGEKVAHQDKVFSLFEPHTRWNQKGKAGVPVELGVPVVIVEDQFQFILSHEILWQGSDVDVAVPIIEKTQKSFPEFRACSFDRGFHSPENRRRLDELLDHNVLPAKGKLSRANQARESEEEFVKARRQHPAVESAINNLEHRGLDRVRSHGAYGFARTVALSIVAANVHRLGLMLRNQQRNKKPPSLRAA